MADQIRVACVGDSITYGHIVSHQDAYPTGLGTQLGSNYFVQNYGLGGLSLLKLVGGNPAYHPAYVDAAQYQQAKDFAPNIVVIMLGTNDASFSYSGSWASTYQSLFVSQYKDLITAFRWLPSHPEVFIATPAYCYGSNAFGIDPNIVNNVIAPLVPTIAADTNAPMIDVKTATSGMGSHFPDNVHPDATATAAIATAVKNSIAAYKYTRASFVKMDTTSKGTWKGAYGTEGYVTSQDASVNNPSIAGNVTWSLTGQGNEQWSSASVDVRALQQTQTGSANRVAGRWSSSNTDGSNFTINLNFTDGANHQVSLYALDWETANQRNELIEVIETVTGRVLDARTVTSFSTGKYLSWNVTGSVQFRVTNHSAYGAAISGVFIDPVRTPIGLLISLKAKSNAKFITAENGGANALIANRASPGGWEQFLCVDASQGTGNGTVGFEAMANSKYLCADLSLASPPYVIANRTSVGGAWESFRWMPQADGTVAIRSVANNLFLTCDPNSPTLKASRTSVGGAWETFNWVAD
ncbi:MAG: GDSL-type esterase/lipase family protein [Chthoniobacterales bacterium]